MDWRGELLNIRHAKPWKEVLYFLKKSIEAHPLDANIYLDTIYFLMDALMEPGPIVDINKEGATVVRELKEILDVSCERFQSNSEFLFFAGYVMSSTGCYFDDNTERRGLQMKQKAAQMDPTNLLYKWGTTFERSSEELRKGILDNRELVDWLKATGLAGEEVNNALQVQLDESIWDYTRRAGNRCDEK